MTFGLFFTIFISGLTLSVDAFAVSVTDGMVYPDLDRKRGLLIPLTFGLFQAAMPIIGFYVSLGLSQIKLIEQIDHWLALIFLAFIGGKMILDGIKEVKEPPGVVKRRRFVFSDVLVQGVATSIDALAVGFTFNVMLEGIKAVQLWAWISVALIGVTTFLVSLAGLMIGIKVGGLFKKKAGIAEIIGGAVLIIIGIKIVVGSYVQLPF